MPANQGDKNKDQRKEFLSEEFFLNTFVKLQVTLASLEKDSEQKSELLHAITDNLTAIAYNIKEIKERDGKVEESLTRILDRLEKINSSILLIEAKIESNTVQSDADIKEIKYAVQNLGSSLLVLKTEKKAKGSDENFNSKKLSITELLSNSWEAIKNVKLIIMIIFLIFLIVSALLGTTGIWPSIPSIISKILGG